MATIVVSLVQQVLLADGSRSFKFNAPMMDLS